MPPPLRWLARGASRRGSAAAAAADAVVMGGAPAPRVPAWCTADGILYGRSIEHALDAFHIDRVDWSSLAADRAS